MEYTTKCRLIQVAVQKSTSVNVNMSIRAQRSLRVRELGLVRSFFRRQLEQV